jgi:RNA polymerase sigma factor (sigma-70 family)
MPDPPDPRAALGAALADHLPWLQGEALRLFPGSGRLDVDDLVQEVLLAACRSPDPVLGGGPARQRAWLRQVLIHRAAHAWRGQSCAKRDQGRDVPLEEAPDECLAAAGPSPGSWVARTEIEEKVEAAVQRLPAADLVVVRLYFWRGMTLAEVAAHLKSDPATVWRLLRHAEARVKALLGPGIDWPEVVRSYRRSAR